jgi:chloramphenicol-sensitive protein RarD
MTTATPGGESRLAPAAAIGCYVIWGLIPLVFQAMGALGISSWEILASRACWGVPSALAFVLAARQGRQVMRVVRQPRVMAWLGLSALLIGINWSVYIWAVNSGRVLETSLGYYIIPLIAMAAGSMIFRERIDRVGAVAIGLAAIGVTIQALALGRLPVISLVLAVTFGAYGIVRKRVAADAQTGLLIECLFLALPSLGYLLWLQHTGGAHLGGSHAASAWLVACGPITATPLLLFAWAARRIPLSVMGFLQFIGPTISFAIGVSQGEAFTPLRALSFAFIWGGAAVFALGAWLRSRAALVATAVSEPA